MAPIFCKHLDGTYPPRSRGPLAVHLYHNHKMSCHTGKGQLQAIVSHGTSGSRHIFAILWQVNRSRDYTAPETIRDTEVRLHTSWPFQVPKPPKRVIIDQSFLATCGSYSSSYHTYILHIIHIYYAYVHDYT
jgi:hypothetical protein